MKRVWKTKIVRAVPDTRGRRPHLMGMKVPMKNIAGRMVSVCTIALVVQAVFQPRLYAAPGDLDLTFGDEGTGKVTTDVGPNARAHGMTIQPDGKILLVGPSNWTSGDFTVVRYQVDGSLDTSVGGTGWVTIDIPDSNDEPMAVAVQEDGKIVVAGATGGWWAGNFVVVRLKSDGSLDDSFGGTGVVITNLGGCEDHANSLAIQGDGKILVSGHAGDGSNKDFAVVRYNPDGSLDPSFGVGGVARADLGGNDHGGYLALAADGSIFMTGYTNAYPIQDYGWALVKYDTDGMLDTTFGEGTGKVLTDFGPNEDYAQAIAVRPDGRIVVGGWARLAHHNLALACYRPDGSLDTAFGTGGITVTDLGAESFIQGLQLQDDGKIVVTGSARWTPQSGRDFIVGRYLGTGALDSSFGGGTGLVNIDFGTGEDYARGVALQSDGKIVAAGATNYLTGDFAVVRLEGDIVADTTPPVIISITATPNTIWPPNNKLVPIQVEVEAVDDSEVEPICGIADVTCNETMNEEDVVLSDSLSLSLMATRLGKGEGRVYTITVMAMDLSGNSSEGTVTVTIPHDQGKKNQGKKK